MEGEPVFGGRGLFAVILNVNAPETGESIFSLYQPAGRAGERFGTCHHKRPCRGIRKTSGLPYRLPLTGDMRRPAPVDNAYPPEGRGAMEHAPDGKGRYHGPLTSWMGRIFACISE